MYGSHTVTSLIDRCASRPASLASASIRGGSGRASYAIPPTDRRSSTKVGLYRAHRAITGLMHTLAGTIVASRTEQEIFKILGQRQVCSSQYVGLTYERRGSMAGAPPTRSRNLNICATLASTAHFAFPFISLCIIIIICIERQMLYNLVAGHLDAAVTLLNKYKNKQRSEEQKTRWGRCGRAGRERMRRRGR
jgi:hypothetical protein